MSSEPASSPTRSSDGGRTRACPSCGESIRWRNAAARCLDCAREYCRSCPDYRGGWMTNVCPDCGSHRAVIV